MSSLSQQNVHRSNWYELIGSYREFMSPRFLTPSVNKVLVYLSES